MRKSAAFVFGGLALLGLAATPARAGVGWSIGLSFSDPGCHRPHCGYYPAYRYRPYPVFVAPPPVIVRPVPVYQPPPVILQPVYQQPAPVIQQPVYQQAPAAAPVFQAPPPAQTVAHDDRSAETERNLPLLASPDEGVRAEAAIQLGRMRAERAVDPLAATLAGDGSPAVREAAARALGLIGSPRALPALNRAAQADADRDVRHSARFAVEVIQTGR
jgi:hypothetical protein